MRPLRLNTRRFIAIGSSLVMAIATAGCPESTVEVKNYLGDATSISIIPGQETTTGVLAVDGAVGAFIVIDQRGDTIPPNYFVWNLRNAANNDSAFAATFSGGSNKVQCVAVGGVTLNVEAVNRPALKASTPISCELRTVRISSEPADKSLLTGAIFSYRAQLFEPNGIEVSGGTGPLHWSSSDPTIATIVDGTGILTALRTGTVTLTAATNLKSKAATTTLFVLPSATLKSVPEGPVDDPTTSRVSVFIGATRDFAAYGPTGALLAGATVWTSSASAIATVSSGRATCVTPGNAVIRADVAGQSAFATITCVSFTASIVSDPAGLPGDPAKALVNLTINGTRDYQVVNIAGTAVSTPVTWGSSNTSIATIGISTGHATCVAPGNVTITATGNGFTQATTTLNCVAVAVNGAVASIALSFAGGALPLGSSRPLTLTYQNANGAPTAANPGDVISISVSLSGIVTYVLASSELKALTAGTSDVQATLRHADGSAVIAKTSVTAVAGEIAGIFLEPSSVEATLPIVSLPFRARVVDINGVIVAPAAGTSIRYKTTTPNVVAIDAVTGMAAGVSAGQSFITAELVTDEATPKVLATTPVPSRVTLYAAGTPNFWGSSRLIVTPDLRRLHVGESVVVEAAVFNTVGQKATFDRIEDLLVESSNASALRVIFKEKTAAGVFYTVTALAVPTTSAIANVRGIVTLTSSISGALSQVPFIVVP